MNFCKLQYSFIRLLHVFLTNIVFPNVSQLRFVSPLDKSESLITIDCGYSCKQILLPTWLRKMKLNADSFHVVKNYNTHLAFDVLYIFSGCVHSANICISKFSKNKHKHPQSINKPLQ